MTAPIATFGDSSVVRSETAFGITAAPLGETGALVCYKDSVTGRGIARVARVSGDQVVVGEEVDFSSEDDGVGADSIAITALSSSTILICWRQAVTNFGLMRVASIGASVDGLDTTISFGDESQFFPPEDAVVPELCCLAVAALSSTKAVLAYQDAFAKSGEAILVTVSGFSATAADERVVLESEDVSSMAVVALDGSTAVVSYRDAAGSGVAATVAVVASNGGEEELQLVATDPFLSPADINWISAVVSGTQGDDLAMSPHEDRAIGRAGISRVLSRVVTTAQLISPEPESTLLGTTVTFSWSAGVDVSEYRLHIGTAPGDTDVLSRSAGTDLSVIVTGLPDNGETLFVSLLSRRGPFTGDGDWAINEFVLTSFDATPPTTAPPFTTTAPPPTTTPVPTTAPPPTTAAPTVDSPIGEGATSVGGTGVDGATVEVFVDTVSVGDADAPVAAGVWTLIGLPPLAVGNEVTARQVSLGELQSDPSDIVTIQAFSDAPTVNSPIFRLATVVSGTSTEAEGTPISVSVNGTLVGSTTVALGGVWAAVVPAVETADLVTATATATDELESPPSAAVTVQAPVSAPPTISFPIGEGATDVGGTGANGGTIRVFIDRGAGFIDSGLADAPVAGGFWSKTGLSPALAPADLVKATQTQSGSSESGDSNIVTVQALTAAPTVDQRFDGDIIVTGTSSETDGTAIEVFVNGGSAGITVVSVGNWSLIVPPLVALDQIKAIATALGKLESPESATVTVLPSVTPPPTVDSPIPAGATSVTGTGLNGATVTVFVNAVSVGDTTVIGTTWVKAVFPLSTLDVVKATQEVPPSSPSVDSNEVTVQEISAAPTVDSPIFDVDTSFGGTRVAGADIEVFVNGGTVGAADAFPAGSTWVKTLSLSEFDQVKAVATESGKLESPDSNIVTVLVPTPPTLVPPIADGDTSVNGTGEDGAIVEVFVNALSVGDADAPVAFGTWAKTGMAALVPGQVVTARQTEPAQPQSGDSNPVTVQAFSDAPTVDAPIVDAQTSIFGTTTEANGTTIKVFVNTFLRGTTTVLNTPNWQDVLLVPVGTGDSVTATATAPGELESPTSAPVVVVGIGTSTIPPTTTHGPVPMVVGVSAAEINVGTRDIAPDDYTPGAPTTVTLTCTIDAGVASTYIVEDIYPAGWIISDISLGGVDNGISVRWFFLDNSSRVLSYKATPPSGETGTKSFSGDISSDGPGGFQLVVFTGETDTARSGLATTTAAPPTTAPATTTVPGTTAPPGPNSCVRSFSVAEYVPEEAFTVSLDCQIDSTEASTYIVEETYPTGWTVSLIAPAGGVDNGTSIRWFFLDNADRVLSYVLTPPPSASDDATFSGDVSSDGPGGFLFTLTSGDRVIGEFVAPGTTTAPPPTTAPPTTTAPGTTVPGGTTTAPGTTTTTVPPPPPGSFPDIEAGDVEHLTVSRLDGGRMLLAYRSNARHRHGRAIVATVSHDGTITFGESSSFLGSRVEEVFSVPLSGDSGMVLYRVGTDIFAKLFSVI